MRRHHKAMEWRCQDIVALAWSCSTTSPHSASLGFLPVNPAGPDLSNGVVRLFCDALIQPALHHGHIGSIGCARVR
jgi:hypothetical protein